MPVDSKGMGGSGLLMKATKSPFNSKSQHDSFTIFWFQIAFVKSWVKDINTLPPVRWESVLLLVSGLRTGNQTGLDGLCID